MLRASILLDTLHGEPQGGIPMGILTQTTPWEKKRCTFWSTYHWLKITLQGIHPCLTYPMPSARVFHPWSRYRKKSQTSGDQLASISWRGVIFPPATAEAEQIAEG